MRSVRKIERILLALLFSFTGMTSVSAADIPTLTWERGKSLNVVLGGYVDNLNWDLYLEGERAKPIAFARTNVNDAGFYVYTISLPRTLKVGPYQIVARSSGEAESLVAVVQVVERFQYNILEIPKDLVFILFGLFAILSMQLSLRSWKRIESADSRFLAELETSPKYANGIFSLHRALLVQRLRWKDRWFGADYLPTDLRSSLDGWVSFLPLLGLILSLSSGVRNDFFPLQQSFSISVLAVLTSISVIDRYSAKIISIGLFGCFIVFNEILNFPSVLSFLVILGMFFLPQYAGDLAREFLYREFKSSKNLRNSVDGFAALVSGLSIFWLYLISESLTQSSSTDASKVTPVALFTAFAYLFRNQRLSPKTHFEESKVRVPPQIHPILRMSTSISLVLCGLAVIYVWTENLFLALSASVLILSGSSTVHFTSRRRRVRQFWILENGIAQLASLLTLFLALYVVALRFPLVVQERSELILLISGLPLFLMALLKMFASPPSFFVSLESELEISSKDGNSKK